MTNDGLEKYQQSDYLCSLEISNHLHEPWPYDHLSHSCLGNKDPFLSSFSRVGINMEIYFVPSIENLIDQFHSSRTGKRGKKMLDNVRSQRINQIKKACEANEY